LRPVGSVTAAVLVALAAGQGLPRARADAATAEFSGEQAFRRVGELLEFERHYEAAGRKRAVDFIAAAMKPYAPAVQRQRLEATERKSGKRYSLVNIIARQNPSERKRILIGSHWDSRLWAEQDPDPAQRNRPIAGANDGASGVAVLLELARHTRALKGFGIDYVFFDGEEMGRPEDIQGYCQGSEYFAKHLGALYPADKPRAALVIDMVGDRSLDLYQEFSSLQSAPTMVSQIWRVASTLGLSSWHAKPKHNIIDDHTPFQRLGIPSILIIDYDYPHWHTQADTLDKVSADSLGAVGRVLLQFLIERQRIGWDIDTLRRP